MRTTEQEPPETSRPAGGTGDAAAAAVPPGDAEDQGARDRGADHDGDQQPGGEQSGGEQPEGDQQPGGDQRSGGGLTGGEWSGGESGTAPKSRSGLNKTVGDMLRSMAVILGCVVLLILIVPRPNEITPRAVDVSAAAGGARGNLSFEPAVPVALPDGWSPQSATFQLGTDNVPMWLLHYRTPNGNYAGVRQAAEPTVAWENRQVMDGREQGTVRVAGRDWVVRSRTDRSITNWVLRAGGVTTVISGTAAEGELTVLAEGLRLPPG